MPQVVTSRLKRFSKGSFLSLIAILLGWFVARGSWLVLAGAIGIGLLVVWPPYLWLGIFAALVPFDNASTVQTGSTGLTLTSIAGLVTLFALLGSSVALGRFRFPIRQAAFWLAFISWETCTTLWAVNKQVAIERLPTIASLFVFYLVVTCCHFSEKEIVRISRFAVFGGCAGAAIVLYLFHSGVFFQKMNMRGSIVFGSSEIEPNVFAASLLLPLSLAIGGFLGSKSLAGKTLSASCALLISLGIFYTTSRGALVAISVMLLFYARKVGVNWRVLVAPTLLGGALLLAPGFLLTRLQQSESTGGAGRLYIWQTGAAALKDYLFAGAGLENFAVIYNDYAARAVHFAGLNRPPHNVFLQVAVESGLIGLFLFLLVISSHLRAAWRREPFANEAENFRLIACEGAAYAMLAASVFLHLLWTKEFWLVWIMLAICSRAPRVDYRDDSAPRDDDPSEVEDSIEQRDFVGTWSSI